MILTYRYRLKDGNAAMRAALRTQARAVNFVWNYLCSVDRQAAGRWSAGMNVRRLGAFALSRLCRGITKELGVHSDTIDAVCRRFEISRRACFPKTPRFRSYKRNLDWIPFSHFSRPAKMDGASITVLGRKYRFWGSRPIPDGAKPRTFCFSTDSRGRWYLNIQVEIPAAPNRSGTAVGIDLGLKTLATLSTGGTVDIPAFYRKTEAQLALHHARGQKICVRAVSAKIANQRRHYLHCVSTRIAQEFAEIYIGDVSPSQIGQTRMAKSVHDAGWAMLKNMLSYKAIALGGMCKVVSEAWTTRTCSACGSIPVSSPKGLNALGIRQWTCSDCGASHDRDVNAARNILRTGAECRPLAEEIAA